MSSLKMNLVGVLVFAVSLVLLIEAQSSSTVRPPQDQAFQCNFDSNWCDFSQDTASDSFDWDRASGRLPHAETGPQFGDHTSGEGMYAYINASNPRKEFDVARMISPTLRFNTNCATLTFFYHALGLHLGSLTVRTGNVDKSSTYSNWSVVFHKNGSDANRSWRRYQTTMLTEAVFQLVFEARVGNGYQGAYAIDDLDVKSVPCPTNLRLDKPPPVGWAVIYNTSNDDGLVTQPPNGWGRLVTALGGIQRGTTKAPPENDEFPQWAIALLVIGCLFISATVLFLIIRYLRKQKKGGTKYKAQNSASTGLPNLGMTAESGTVANRYPSLDTESSFELPSTSKQTISVPVEGRKSVRFQGDYDTEYGFGLKMSNGSALPSSLAPVPKDVLKDAEKAERRAARRAKYARSKLTVRQRRKLRIAAKLAAKAEKEKRATNPQGKQAPLTFSLLQQGDKFAAEPGKRRPIPLPPPHILDMLMKMRSPNSIQGRMKARAETAGPSTSSSHGGDGDPNSVVAVVEPNRYIPRQAIHRNDLGVEDVDDDEFDDDDDDETMEAENGSDRESNASEIDEIVAEWERTQLAEADQVRMARSALPALTTSGGIIVAQNTQRNKITVISNQQQQPQNLAPSSSSNSYNAPQQRGDLLPPSASSSSFSSYNQGPARPSSTPVQVISHPAPGGLYDGLDDDDDD